MQMIPSGSCWSGSLRAALSVLTLGVDFGPYSPISFRQFMYLLQANKGISPNPPVYPRCHHWSCLLTKDEHFLSSNITGPLWPHNKYTDGNTMEQKQGIAEERDVLSGAMAQTIKRKVHGQNSKLLSPPPTLHCRFEIPLFLFLEGCL